MTTQEITVRVAKTIQEEQFEPLTAEVIIRETCPKKKYNERAAEVLQQASDQVFGFLGIGAEEGGGGEGEEYVEGEGAGEEYVEGEGEGYVEGEGEGGEGEGGEGVAGEFDGFAGNEDEGEGGDSEFGDFFDENPGGEEE